MKLITAKLWTDRVLICECHPFDCHEMITLKASSDDEKISAIDNYCIDNNYEVSKIIDTFLEMYMYVEKQMIPDSSIEIITKHIKKI